MDTQVGKHYTDWNKITWLHRDVRSLSFPLMARRWPATTCTWIYHQIEFPSPTSSNRRNADQGATLEWKRARERERVNVVHSLFLVLRPSWIYKFPVFLFDTERDIISTMDTRVGSGKSMEGEHRILDNVFCT